MSTMRMRMPHHDNPNRPFSSYERSDGDGPTFNKPPPMTNNIYDDVLANENADSGVLRTVLQQPFDISTSWINFTHTAFKYPSGAMASSLGFPFTDAQWKELERQAMIYKYMVAFVPVPSELLPVTRNLSAADISQTPFGNKFKLRLSNGSDPEPGRCKRTDGKKWRCSREVAPDQKYCERHMHRGRPRSRKQVENRANNPNKKPRLENQGTLQQTISHPTTFAFSNSSSINNNGSQLHHLGYTALPYQHLPVFLDKSTVKAANLEPLAPLSSTDKKARSFWVEKEDTLSMANSYPQWQHLMQSKIELNSNTLLCDTDSSVLSHGFVEEPFLYLNSYVNFDTSQQDGECVNLFLDSDVVSLGSSFLAENPRNIDAWSNKESSVSSIGKLSPSSLALSMGGLGYNYINDEMGTSSKFLDSWRIPAAWVGSPPGGPLAEVVSPCSLTVTPSAVSNQSSPIRGNGDTESLVATTMSSPLMVLQKTFTSLSADTSGSSSSPTFGSCKEKQDIFVE